MKILVAADGSKHSKKAMAVVAKVAKDLKAKIDVIHAVVIIDDNLRFGIPTPGIREALEAEGVAILKDARAFFGKKKIKVGTILEYGEPSDVIIRKGKKYDLIVMGTIGMSGLEKFLLGSVSDRVVRYASCSTLIVR